MNRIFPSLICAVLLAGCGESYRLVAARLELVDVSYQAYPQILNTVSGILVPKGFEDFGTDLCMIKLLEQSRQPSVDSAREIIDQLRRQRTFLTHDDSIRVVVDDYTGGVPRHIAPVEGRPERNVVEIEIYESRPGGLGPRGIETFQSLQVGLSKVYGPSLKVLAPPVSDEAEYKRITFAERVTQLVWWVISCLLFTLLFGGLVYGVLRMVRLGVGARRMIFAIATAALAAPIPLHGVMISLFVPNLATISWMGAALRPQEIWLILASLVACMALTSVISLAVIRPKKIEHVDAHVS